MVVLDHPSQPVAGGSRNGTQVPARHEKQTCAWSGSRSNPRGQPSILKLPSSTPCRHYIPLKLDLDRLFHPDNTAAPNNDTPSANENPPTAKDTPEARCMYLQQRTGINVSHIFNAVLKSRRDARLACPFSTFHPA